MNVLHIIDSLGLGGAQTVVKGIFEKQKENENIFLFALRRREITTEINHKDIIIYNSKLRYSLLPIFNLKRIINENNIDVLHCHLLRSQVFGWLLKKLFFPKIQLIFHEHGEIFRKKWSFVNFLRTCRKDVNLFIAVSEATKQKLIENSEIPKEKIKVLYNFADLEKFNPEVLGKYDKDKQREKIRIRGSDFVAGFAGRLSKIKGCDLLIKSVPYINIQNFKLLIAGNGTEKKKLQKLVKELRIGDKVIFCGYIKNILKFYKLIDCFVFSSISEASPMAFYEIQAIGITIIANDVVALNEFIKDGENGLIFQKNNEKDLADKIELVYNNSELRAQLVRKGIGNIKKYSFENYIKQLDKVYKNLHATKEKN